MQRIALIAVSALAVTTATPVAAQVVYNNGGPLTVSGNDATQWIQTEDFSFGSNTVLTGAGLYFAGFGGIGNYDGTFNYYIFDDAAGLPGSILSSGAVTPTITDTGTPWDYGGNIFEFEFGFGDFNALGGGVYHLGVHLGADYLRDDLYWVTTSNNATVRGLESNGGTLDNWSNNGQEHAFYLTGRRVDGAVPEPATWALLFLGFAAVGGAMRSQKRRQTVTVRYA